MSMKDFDQILIVNNQNMPKRNYKFLTLKAYKWSHPFLTDFEWLKVNTKQRLVREGEDYLKCVL